MMESGKRGKDGLHEFNPQTAFMGNHHLLSERQRLARMTSTDAALAAKPLVMQSILFLRTAGAAARCAAIKNFLMFLSENGMILPWWPKPVENTGFSNFTQISVVSLMLLSKQCRLFLLRISKSTAPRSPMPSRFLNSQ